MAFSHNDTDKHSDKNERQPIVHDVDEVSTSFTDLHQRKRDRLCCTWIAAVILLLITAGAIAVSLWVVFSKPHTKVAHGSSTLGGPYREAAVASDAGPCSTIGKNIFIKKGSAVDAAIATMFCVGIINMHSAGIGGGGFMLVYSRKTKEAEVIDFRETAPASATETMFVNASYKSLNTTLATGVPGEVRGYRTAWRRHGRLPWKQLVQPAIDKAKEGFKINIPLHTVMEEHKNAIKRDPGLSQLLTNKDGSLKKLGETITNPELGKTLEFIRDDPEGFYNGSLAKKIVKDVQQRGGNITLDDLKGYNVSIRKAIINTLGDMRWFTAPPPASGAVISLIINILKGYNLTQSSGNYSNVPLTYHRIIEAFKFAFAWRGQLGDPAFNSDSEKIVQRMTDPAFAELLREKISDNHTYHNLSFYAPHSYPKFDRGTSHLSLVGPTGDAVAVTSTVNYYFGCKFRSTETGIVYNNEMADFSSPGQPNPDGLEPSKSNFIVPGKRPQSSISPVIFTEKNGTVRIVAGASGGPLITTATSLTIVNKLWLGKNISQSVDHPRVHHQLVPDKARIENEKPYAISQHIQDGLTKRRHKLVNETEFAAVQTVVREDSGEMYGKCDPRKHGRPSGY